MKIQIINGPNLNRLATREEKFYGKEDFDVILNWLMENCKGIEIHYFQSNIEGEIIDRIQALPVENMEGLVINPGAYSHYSIAIRDAIDALPIPVIEVHLSNIYSRETFRQISVISPVVVGVISGLGKESYRLAIDYFSNTKKKKIGFKS